MSHCAVTVVIHDWTDWTVDRKLLEVDAKTGKLSVEVGEVTALQQWVVGETDTRWQVRCTESNLLSLGEVLINVSVELHLSNVSYWENLFWPDLSGVENVKVKVVLSGFRADLNTKLPGWEGTLRNGIVQISAVEVWILTTDLKGLVPNKRVDSKCWGEVELDKASDTFLINQGEGVDTETLHHTVGSWDTTIRHSPHEHVSSLGVQELEIPEVIVGCLCLWNLVVWLWLSGVDNIWELHSILNKEDWNIVSDNVPVALIREHLNGETTNISYGIGT